MLYNRDMSETNVRKALADDLQTVETMQRRWEAEEIMRGFVAADAGLLQSRMGEYFLVAEHGGRLVGFVCGSAHISEGNAVFLAGERYLEVDDLYVSPEMRDQGIGGGLLDALLVQARQEGIQRFLAYSSSRDTDATLRFYRKHDFETWYVQMFR
jgi:ribosomal protein S18 acetylase RimI-like enzyme